MATKHNKRVHRLFYTYPDDYVDGDNRQKSERNSKESFVYSAPSDVSILFKATSSSTQSCRLVRRSRTKGGILIEEWTVVKERAIPEMRWGFWRNIVCMGIIGYNRDGAEVLAKVPKKRKSCFSSGQGGQSKQMNSPWQYSRAELRGHHQALDLPGHLPGSLSDCSPANATW